MSLPTLLVAGATGETPLARVQSWIRTRLPEFGGRQASLANRILIVRAETGSGKSTVLPVGIFRIFRDEKTAVRQLYRGPSVICTQPRVLTAVALASEVASERLIGNSRVRLNPDMDLGKTVGFQTGPVSNRPAAGLIYATAGFLAAQLRRQTDAEIMEQYRVIIVDEAHERSVDLDVMLMLLRDFFIRNESNARLPFLLLTSATIDTSRYTEYFGIAADNVIEVIGRQYKINTNWPQYGTNNYPDEAAATAVRIHEANANDVPERADILIFMPGAAETAMVVAALSKANNKYCGSDVAAEAATEAATEATKHRPFIILTLNREVVVSQTGDFALLFVPPDQLPWVCGRAPARRIVVATTVAETGITIDTLRYVIDCGWNRAPETYHMWNVGGLITRPATRSRVRQRRGRVGRLFEGEFYPLYTENAYKALDDQQLPEVITDGVNKVYLSLVGAQQAQKFALGALPEFRAEDIALLDPPPPEAFLMANTSALMCGFVAADTAIGGGASARGYGLTPLGKLAAPLMYTGMEGARVFFGGYAWGAAAADLLTIIALFGSPLKRLYARTKRGTTVALPGAAALRVALPHFFMGRGTIFKSAEGGTEGGIDSTEGGVDSTEGGVEGRPAEPPTASEEFYYRARLLIADDFIEGLLLYDAFMAQVSAKSDLCHTMAWCKKMELDFDMFISIMKRREEICEELVSNGFNIYRAESRRIRLLPADQFLEGVCALKQCLYEAFRLNVLKYDPTHNVYRTKQNLKVKVPPMFTEQARASLLAGLPAGESEPDRPQWILTDRIVLAPAPKREEDRGLPLLYLPETNLVSVLDGYVDVDLDFCSYRSFQKF